MQHLQSPAPVGLLMSPVGSFATGSCRQRVRPCPRCPQRGIDCGALFRDKQLPVDGAAVGVIQALKLNPEIMIAAASRVVRSRIEPTGRAFARRVVSSRTTA